MIGRLLGALIGAIAYFSVATMLALGLIGGYLWSSGRLDPPHREQLIAVLRGVDLLALRDVALKEIHVEHEETPAHDEVLAERALKLRQLEMRELAVQTAGDRMRFERNTLGQEKETVDRARAVFDAQLAEVVSGAAAEGRDSVRQILENVKPLQAKEQLLRMIEEGQINEVVMLVGEMSLSKSKKILDEFRAPEEVDKLAEILRRMREGEPESGLAGQAQNQLQK